MQENLHDSQRTKSQWKKRFFGVVLLLAVFGLGTSVGSYRSIRQFVKGEDGTVEIAKVLDVYAQSRSSNVSFQQFWDVWDMIKSSYVEQPVDEVSLFYGAISGLVAGLNDPYSTYFPPTEAKEFAKDLAGEFEGIGAEIGIREGQLIVVAPLPGSPAEQAGLKAGDVLYAIDGKDTYGMALDEAVLAIRGKKGTTVVLTISHNGRATSEDVTVVRDTITIPTVTMDMDDTGIAYVRISYFNESTWADFDAVVQELVNKKVKGIVLDMRMNPGGFLQTSVDVASEWIEQGSIVSERFADGKENIHRSRGKHRLSNIPTVVLVDGGTASGSEIVAGALQDHHAGVVMGAQTFGKGSVQDFEILPDGSAIKLTIAKWFTPDGRAINGEGIAPDIVLDDMYAPQGDDTSTIDDIGLQRAREYLQK